MMENNKRKIESAEGYTEFVRVFATLLDQQLTLVEGYMNEQEGAHNLIQQMPALISLVNTVGYLRGQDGMFLDIRPSTENQKEFYGYEDMFEKRLSTLIDYILNSDEKEYYRERLESYFVKARTKSF
ncbi:MAG: hypothetical protein KBD27_03500 [Candidatus Moranbacteria bacterium]|nr:hypothetical protein [Candidatus Moranbacteria bacterium]